MNYQETLNYLFSALPMYQQVGSTAYKADLNNAHLLDEHFHYPHSRYRTVHVAGTNGKGSVSHMVAAVLQENGYKTGLYTSPHLFDFRERIKVDGIPVAQEFVVSFTEKNRKIFEKIRPSFFEMTVFMAFEYFREQNIDIAVIEVGMGGRLDTTNIITPVLSVITNIGLDHTQVLGDTLQKIAVEKAGIIKESIPVIIGETQAETKPVFMDIAKSKNCEIAFADQYFSVDSRKEFSSDEVFYHFSKSSYPNISEVSLDLKGAYQQKNLITVLMTLFHLNNLGLRLNNTEIITALRQVKKLTGFEGRWIEIGHNPLIICDTAHNAEGMKEVMKQLNETLHKDLHFVLGFVSDKNLDKLFNLFPRQASYYLCEPKIPRARKVLELARDFSGKGYHFSTHATVTEAFLAAQHNAVKEDCIYIGGSTFVVADFLAWKNGEKTF